MAINIGNFLKALSKEGLSTGDLNYGGYINPMDALFGREPLPRDIMLPAETSREKEFFRRQGYLTADTQRPIGSGETLYNGMPLDPAELYTMFKTNEFYEKIPTGYDIMEGRTIATPEQIEKRRKYNNIANYALSYPGTRFTPDILNLLSEYLDPDTMAKAIAISQAETGMGKAASSFRGDGKLKNINWFGIHIPKNGQPGNVYDPETWEEMAEDILRNLGPGSKYSTLTPENIEEWTGGTRSEDWTRIVRDALRTMGY